MYVLQKFQVWTIFRPWLTMINHVQKWLSLYSAKMQWIDTHIDVFPISFSFNHNLTVVNHDQPR